MDEQTGTGAELFSASDMPDIQGEEITQNNESPAVEETIDGTDSENTVSNTSTDSAEKQESQVGDALTDFLAKKGIKSDDPEALRKVAEMYQNSEKAFYEKSQQKAQLERQLAEAQLPQATPNEQALAEVRAMKTELSVERWKQSHNITPEIEQRMVEWCSQPMIDQSGRVLVDYNGNPIIRGYGIINGTLSLDDVYKIVGGDSPKVDNLKESLKEEIRKEMIARQSAKRPSMNSTNSQQFGASEQSDPFADALLGN